MLSYYYDSVCNRFKRKVNKGNDMSLEDIFNWIWTVNILWIILPIIALVILIINLDTIVDNWGLIAVWIGLLAFLWIYS